MTRLMQTQEAEERRKTAACAANTGEGNPRWSGDNPDLAREFGVGKTTINAIVSGCGWQRAAVPQ